MANNYVVAPLITGDATFSDGVYTDNVEIYGYLQVDGQLISDDTIVSTLNVLSTIDSTSTNTGAVVIAGGLGIGQDTFIGGFLDVGSTINSINISTGSLVVSGGLAVNNNIWIGGNFHALSNIQTTGPTVGTLQIVGGAGITQSLALGTGLLVHEGTNAKQGIASLVAGSSTLSNTSITTNSRIFLTAQSTTQPTNVGALFVSASTPSASFVVRSTNAQDSSTFAYEIFEAC